MDERTLMPLLGRLAGGEIWLVIVYVVCMFAVATFRHRLICNPSRFRLSYNFFALYLMVPAIAEGIVALCVLDTASRGRSEGGLGLGLLAVTVLVNVLDKLFLAGSIVCCLGSLIERGGELPSAGS